MGYLTNTSLTYVNVNIERMPIYFLCSPADKRTIEQEIVQTGAPYILHSTKDSKLSISPSSAWGLPGGFDMDVMTVIHHKLYEITREMGFCPSYVRLHLSEFPQIMRISRTGQLYDHIRQSLIRMSEITLYQENFIQLKEEDGQTSEYKDRVLKLFQYLGGNKIERIKTGGEPFQQCHVDLMIPEWHRMCIERNYVTSFDTALYFSLPSERSKRLYRFLEYIRYEKVISVPLSKIIRELHLERLQGALNRAIQRALDPLKEKGVLERYEIGQMTEIEFASFKTATPKLLYKPTLPPLTIQQLDLLQTLVNDLDDEKSRPYFHRVVTQYRDNDIIRCLALTKETAAYNKINKSLGAIFVDTLKRQVPSYSQGELRGIA